MKKISASLVVLALFVCGCNPNHQVQQNVNEKSVNVKNSKIETVDRKTGQEIAKHLVNIASKMPNVNDAAAVVLGRYAIVGIDVDPTIDRSKVGTIKYSVAESLKKDPFGANAIVIADPDTFQRLKDISAEIQKGRPIQGIMNQLAEIAGRLMPEGPSNMGNPRTP